MPQPTTTTPARRRASSPAVPPPVVDPAVELLTELQIRIEQLEGIVERLERAGEKAARGGAGRATKVPFLPGAAPPVHTPRPPGKSFAGAIRDHQAPKQKLPATVAEHEADEKARILEALAKTNWNRSDAAALLKIPRRTFYRRLTHYGIK